MEVKIKGGTIVGVWDEPKKEPKEEKAKQPKETKKKTK